MIDINGTPSICTQHGLICPAGCSADRIEPTQETAKPSVAIAEVPIELGPGQNIIEVKVKAPGVVRAATFWIQEPKVIAARMRGVEKIAQPMLYVECDPNGELQDRVFLFQQSNAVFRPKDGWAVKYLTTIAGQVALHVFEIVVAPS